MIPNFYRKTGPKRHKLTTLLVKQDELEGRRGRLMKSYKAFVMDEKSEVHDEFKDDISLQYEAANMFQNLEGKLMVRMQSILTRIKAW